MGRGSCAPLGGGRGRGRWCHSSSSVLLPSSHSSRGWSSSWDLLWDLLWGREVPKLGLSPPHSTPLAESSVSPRFRGTGKRGIHHPNIPTPLERGRLRMCSGPGERWGSRGRWCRRSPPDLSQGSTPALTREREFSWHWLNTGAASIPQCLAGRGAAVPAFPMAAAHSRAVPPAGPSSCARLGQDKAPSLLEMRHQGWQVGTTSRLPGTAPCRLLGPASLGVRNLFRAVSGPQRVWKLLFPGEIPPGSGPACEGVFSLCLQQEPPLGWGRCRVWVPRDPFTGSIPFPSPALALGSWGSPHWLHPVPISGAVAMQAEEGASPRSSLGTSGVKDHKLCPSLIR